MSDNQSVLSQLMAVIEDRKQNPPPRSYTSKLFAGGVEKIGAKVLEESQEVVEAAGGTYHGHILNVGDGPESERKYRDPNGVVIDVTSPAHADSSWRVPTDS